MEKRDLLIRFFDEADKDMSVPYKRFRADNYDLVRVLDSATQDGYLKERRNEDKYYLTLRGLKKISGKPYKNFLTKWEPFFSILRYHYKENLDLPLLLEKIAHAMNVDVVDLKHELRQFIDEFYFCNFSSDEEVSIFVNENILSYWRLDEFIGYVPQSNSEKEKINDSILGGSSEYKNEGDIFPEIPATEVLGKHLDYKNAILNFINQAIESKNGHGIVTGILGKWGSGKSTVINAICKDLSDSQHVVFLNPWKDHVEGNYHDYLLKKTARSIPYAKFKKVRAIRNKLKEIDNKYKFIFLLILLLINGFLYIKSDFDYVGFLGGWFSSFIVLLGSLWGLSIVGKKEFFSTFIIMASKLEAFFNIREYSDISKFSGENKPIIYFFDDIDRCSPNVVVDLMEVIHKLGSTGSMVFVACDIDVLKYSYEKYYGENSREFRGVDEYLRKIINVYVYLPRLTKKEVRKLGITGDYVPDRDGEPGKISDLKYIGPTAYNSVVRILSSGEKSYYLLMELVDRIVDDHIYELNLNIRDMKIFSNSLKIYLDANIGGSFKDKLQMGTFLFCYLFFKEKIEELFEGKTKHDILHKYMNAGDMDLGELFDSVGGRYIDKRHN